MTTFTATAPPVDGRAPIPFLDLGATHAEIRAELDEVHRRTVDDNAFIGGEAVVRFETAWAAYCGVGHAVGVANGTDAIELVLRGLGVGPGDEVLVPTNTFVATAEAVVAVGATPHLIDVHPGTLLLEPAVVQAAIGPRTAAIIAVHLYGEMAPMTELRQIADTAGLALVEDAAQAHGAAWDGHRAGSLGDAACFSFYPGKNLGALGDGGAVVTDDGALAANVRSLGNHGRRATSHHGHPLLGRNSRLDGLQAGFLEVKLGHLDRWNDARRRAAAGYDRHLAAAPWIQRLERRSASRGVHHLYPVAVDDRHAVRDALAERGIASGIHYPVPCHREPALQGLARYGRCEVAETTADRLLSLPMSPHLSDDDVAAVSTALIEVTRPDAGGGR